MTDTISQSNFRDILREIEVEIPRVNYLTHIDDKRKLAYIETPKVACTSVKKFMMDQYSGGELPMPNPSQVHDRSRSPLKQLSTISPEEGAQVLWGSTYRRFSFVRNPYSRLLSGYLDKLVANEYERARHLPRMGFEPGSHPTLLEFLERLAQQTDAERDIHFVTQSSLLMVEYVEYDYIGRFEGFDRDFLKLQATFFGVDHPTESYEDFGKHHASNANAKIAQYFGAREIELTRQIYRNDFLIFGYSEDIERASDRMPPVNVKTLSGTACSIGFANERMSIDQLIAKLNGLIGAYKRISRIPGGRPRLRGAGVAQAFQKLNANNKTKEILELTAKYPQAARQMPLVANQVVKALLARGEIEAAANSLKELREFHPNDLGLLFLGVEIGYRADKPDAAAVMFERICAKEALPRWTHRILMTNYMKYFHHSLEKGAGLAERIFFDDKFMQDPGQEWIAADYFLANLLQNKPVDHRLLAKLRSTLKASTWEDNTKSVISRFMLQGLDFEESLERRTLISELLGNGDRRTLVRVLGWRMHPLNDFSFSDKENSLLGEIATKQQAQGNSDLACMVKAMRGDNVSEMLVGRKVALGKKNAKLQRKPKLALCISGQLRGFQKCAAEWRSNHLFEVADVTIFVSTWSRIGRKFPIPSHAARSFKGSFINAFRETWHRIGGHDAILKNYPNFSALLQNNDPVETEDIAAVYRTDAIEVFDDFDPRFEGFTNQEKMFFHIDNAFQMAARSGKDFDLYMRLRPDLEAFEPTDWSWDEVLAIAYEEGKLFTDIGFKINNPHGLFVGDQLAVGQFEVMSHYSSLFPRLRAAKGEQDLAITIDGGPKPHSTLAFHLAAGGIFPLMVNATEPTEPVDHTRLMPEEIAEALSKDLPEASRNSDPLWLAIQKDLRVAAK